MASQRTVCVAALGEGA